MILLLLCLIWGQSLLPAAQSHAESEAVKNFLFTLVRPLMDWMERMDLDLRKVAHATEFCALGAVWMAELSRSPKAAFRALSRCGLAALVDETLQYIPAGRGPGVKDIWIDLLGAGFGILLVGLWRRSRKTRG